MKNLSTNQLRLLKIVDEHTAWEGDERPGAKLVSAYTRYRACDGVTLRAIQRRGLIEGNYTNYSITEEGILALATLTGGPRK
jgi:hypothetical protein